MTSDPSTDPRLEPSVERPRMSRRRRYTLLAATIAIPVHGAVLYALLSRQPETVVVDRVEHTTSTTVVTIPAPMIVTPPAAAPAPPAPPPVEVARTCPAPRTDAPAVIPPDLPEIVSGLAVSPTNAGWIAAWNDTHVYASTDAGKTFARVLDGPGVVRAVQFDCFGTVVVARGDRLGVRAAGVESWRAIPKLELAKPEARVTLIGGGRDVIVVGVAPDTATARVAVSRDRGAHWRYHDLSEYTSEAAPAAGFQRADGSIVVGVSVPDCMSDDLSWIEISPSGKTTKHWIAMPGTSFGFWKEQVFARGASRRLALPDDAHDQWKTYAEEYWGEPVQAPYPLFVRDGTATRIVGGEPRPLSLLIDGDQLAMDPAGRLWSIACGRLWIAMKDRSSGYCAGD